MIPWRIPILSQKKKKKSWCHCLDKGLLVHLQVDRRWRCERHKVDCFELYHKQSESWSQYVSCENEKSIGTKICCIYIITINCRLLG